MKAVQIRAYGGIEELKIVNVPVPEPKANEVRVRVVAAGTNPGEISIRTGALAKMYPMDFPFGQGSDYAGTIDAVGSGVHDFKRGDEVLGRVDTRSAQAQFVIAPVDKVVRKPPSLDWYRAGSLFVVASTAAATVRATGVKSGDVVVVANAAGGVGSFAVQLARRTGARVIGLSSEKNAEFLRSLGVEFVAYGDDLESRLRDALPSGIDAFIDLFGKGYVDLALRLGIAKERIDTIIDFEAAQRTGVKTEGSAEASDSKTLTDIAELVAWGEIVMPLSAIYPFSRLHDAYRDLERRKARGKIVLAIDPELPDVLRSATNDG